MQRNHLTKEQMFYKICIDNNSFSTKEIIVMDNKLETISNLFEGKEIRSIWNAEKEEYYFK